MSVCEIPFVTRNAFRTCSAPYCNVCLVRPYRTPLRYLRNGTIFGKKKSMCVLSVYKFVCNISQYAKNSKRYYYTLKEVIKIG